MKILALSLSIGFLTFEAFAYQGCELTGTTHNFIVWSDPNLVSPVYLSKESLQFQQTSGIETVALKKLGAFVKNQAQTVIYEAYLAQTQVFVTVDLATQRLELSEFADTKIVNFIKKKFINCESFR